MSVTCLVIEGLKVVGVFYGLFVGDSRFHKLHFFVRSCVLVPLLMFVEDVENCNRMIKGKRRASLFWTIVYHNPSPRDYAQGLVHDGFFEAFPQMLICAYYVYIFPSGRISTLVLVLINVLILKAATILLYIFWTRKSQRLKARTASTTKGHTFLPRLPMLYKPPSFGHYHGGKSLQLALEEREVQDNVVNVADINLPYTATEIRPFNEAEEDENEKEIEKETSRNASEHSSYLRIPSLSKSSGSSSASDSHQDIDDKVLPLAQQAQPRGCFVQFGKQQVRVEGSRRSNLALLDNSSLSTTPGSTLNENLFPRNSPFLVHVNSFVEEPENESEDLKNPDENEDRQSSPEVPVFDVVLNDEKPELSSGESTPLKVSSRVSTPSPIPVEVLQWMFEHDGDTILNTDSFSSASHTHEETSFEVETEEIATNGEDTIKETGTELDCDTAGMVISFSRSGNEIDEYADLSVVFENDFELEDEEKEAGDKLWELYRCLADLEQFDNFHTLHTSFESDPLGSNYRSPIQSVLGLNHGWSSCPSSHSGDEQVEEDFDTTGLDLLASSVGGGESADEQVEEDLDATDLNLLASVAVLKGN
eukprot:CAMPEP_0175125982 /NCGR_PEP_ID=MMETSP0087-20121206/3603_1 /TAXON_ID=136419 /ORGANISM="Unknown Unknown, Strain D1" /LENGTH=590 /DNA_ID=CAMNT_0016407849 /DNA_START=162 /DNA_END=1935 /DNA_ORIENTATION=+